MADEQNRLNLLKQQTEELEKQASIKQTLLENDRRYGKPTMEAIEKLTSQIAENEAEITRLINARNLSNEVSLEKEIDKLKWIESEKEGRDIGKNKAVFLWTKYYRKNWIKNLAKLKLI